MVVPGSMTRTTGPRYTVVVGPTGSVVLVDAVVGDAGTGTVLEVDVGTTVATGPVAVRGSRPDTNVAMQSTPGKYKRI